MSSQGLGEPKPKPSSTLDEGGEVGLDLLEDGLARSCPDLYSTWYTLQYTSVVTKKCWFLVL
jgi:hypothetical protein